jgi:hypothetical protein
MAKLKISTQGFDVLIQQLNNLNADTRQVVEDSLSEAFEFVKGQAETNIARHRLTGQTEDSIIEQPSIIWNNSKASVEVGFDIANGGLPSIFLMYGTPRKITPDKKLYAAFYGTKTKKKIKEIMEEHMMEVIRNMGG